MRKIILLFLLAGTFTAHAQLDYNLTKSSGTFTYLTSPTVTATAWNQTFIMKMPFQFKYFSNTYDSLKITPNAISFTSFKRDNIMAGQDDYYYTGTVYPPGSEISYKIEGTTPNRIIKVQFKNLQSATTDTADDYYVNNQIWVYETGSKFEMHFGPNLITDINFDKFYFGFIDADNSPYYAISGSAASPVLYHVTNVGTFNGINSHPTEGTIYSFTPNNGTGFRPISRNYLFSQNASGFTYKGSAGTILIITDITGKEIARGTSDTNGFYSFTNDALSNGVYIVNIAEGNAILTEKILVNR